jgi:hypothetical protein
MNSRSFTKSYSFRSELWRYKGAAGWHFLTLPDGVSRKIRRNHGHSEEGWGRLKVAARIGGSDWVTAIWYDSKYRAYLLPVKAVVRKAEKIKAGSRVSVSLRIDDDGFRLE